MKREDLAIGALWLLVIFVIGAVIYAVLHTPPQFVQFAGVLVAAAATILVAILSHALSVSKEQKLEQQKQKAKNYSDLLEKVAPFVRDRTARQDDLETAHLVSWVIGSPDVIRFTQDFLKDRSAATLQKTLIAMRKDIGFHDPDPAIDLIVLGPRTPSPPPPPPPSIET